MGFLTYHGISNVSIFSNVLTAMKKANSKLYLENCYIMELNEKLRETAELLENENQVLLNELKQRLAGTSSASIAAATSENYSREADQLSTASALEASTSMCTKASKSRKKSKK